MSLPMVIFTMIAWFFIGAMAGRSETIAEFKVTEVRCTNSTKCDAMVVNGDIGILIGVDSTKVHVGDVLKLVK